MSVFLLVNILLGLVALVGILGLCVWAIRTQGSDAIGRAEGRRSRPDRRQRAIPHFPARAERRQGARREPDGGMGSRATA
jgi:hypothetical protein